MTESVPESLDRSDVRAVSGPGKHAFVDATAHGHCDTTQHNLNKSPAAKCRIRL